MSEDLRTEILTHAMNGSLLHAIFHEYGKRWLQDDDPVMTMLADLHNAGDIDVLALVNLGSVEPYKGHAFFNGQQVYRALISRLQAPAEVLMNVVQTLIDAAGQDMAAGLPVEEFAKWCGQDPARPAELLALVDRKVPNADRFLTIAIKNGVTVDRAFFMDRAGSVRANCTRGWQGGMSRTQKPRSFSPFRYFNSSPEVIRLVVMMYVRFPLSLRNVEDLLFERGIDISHETVRYWWNRFGPLFAGDIRRQRISRMRGILHWRWHLDEMYVKVNGEMVYLWRAVDHEGEILENYITKKRDKRAALAFMKKALKRHGAPAKIVTDGLRSYRAAMAELENHEKQEIGRWANNRAENSHLPFRRRERAMLRFRQMKALQKFASVHANVHNHFSLERHLIDRQTYKERRSAALAEWQSLMG